MTFNESVNIFLALPLCLFGAVLPPLGTVPPDFAADGAFVAVKLFGDFGDGAVAGQVLDMVLFVLGQLCVAHGNLSPGAIGGMLEQVRSGAMSEIVALFICALVVLVTYFVVFVERGQRKILVNYAH